jgi:ricin-type beta-trefoil lectin protein
MCLDVAHAATYNAAPVVQAPCMGSKYPNQLWLFEPWLDGSGNYWLRPLHAGSMSLDVAHGSALHAAPVVIATFRGNWNQLWRFQVRR